MQSEIIVKDIPGQIFDKFLQDLKVVEIPDDIIERLRSTLLEERSVNESAINLSIFPNQQTS